MVSAIWLFQSSLFLSHLSLSSFCVLSKLGPCPATVSTQLSSVLTHPATASCSLPSVHGWVSTPLPSCRPRGTRGAFRQGLELPRASCAGRAAAVLAPARSWRCAGENCFPCLPQSGVPVFRVTVCFPGGDTRSGVSARLGSSPSLLSAAPRSPGLHASSSFPLFLSLVLLSTCPGRRAFSVQLGHRCLEWGQAAVSPPRDASCGTCAQSPCWPAPLTSC